MMHASASLVQNYMYHWICQFQGFTKKYSWRRVEILWKQHEDSGPYENLRSVTANNTTHIAGMHTMQKCEQLKSISPGLFLCNDLIGVLQQTQQQPAIWWEETEQSQAGETHHHLQGVLGFLIYR